LEAGWGDGLRAAVGAREGVRLGVWVEACAAGADGSGLVDGVTAMGDRGAEALPEEPVLGTTDGETDGQDDAAVAVGEADCSQAGPPAMKRVVWRCRVTSATALPMRHADAATATRIRLRMAHPISLGTLSTHQRKSPQKPIGVPA